MYSKTQDKIIIKTACNKYKQNNTTSTYAAKNIMDSCISQFLN